MKLSEINNIINDVISEEIRKTIIMESSNKEVYHIKYEGEPIATFDTELEAQEALPNYKTKTTGDLIIEKGVYESHEDMLDKLDEMGEELEEKENTNMENQEPIDEKLVGKQKNIDKNNNGKIDAEDFKILNKEEEGVSHYTQDGKEWKGKVHKMPDGSLMSGNPHDVDGSGVDGKSEKLQHKDDLNEDDMEDTFGDDYESLPDGEMNEEPSMCSECGGMMNEEGMCNECSGGMYESKSKKKTLRLKESEMLEMIQRIVKESVPGITVTQRAQTQSKKDNEAHASEVAKKLEKVNSFDGNGNPKFPNQISKGDKVARQNTPEQEDEIAVQRGGGLEDLNYDIEPSQQFKDRLKKSLEGHTTTGNAQDAGNVIKSDLGKDIAKKVERKAELRKNRVMYNKDVQPVKIVKESKNNLSSILEEEIKKMKNIAGYDKKTQ